MPRGVLPFYLPGRPVRGRLIRLGALAEALLARHDNHPAVSRLAGEALALAAALATALKYRGSFSVQAKGDGPVGMLVADCTEQGALRFYARADAPRLAALLDAAPQPTAAALLGTGYLAFSVDQGPDRERHQGIVAIEGTTLAEMTLHYFQSSEQLRCAVRLACTQGPHGWRAGALILEQIAEGGNIETQAEAAESWRTATLLAGTLGEAELLDDDLPPEQLLYRLFGAEGVAADRARALAYGCRCSRARLVEILEGFAPADLDHMVVPGNAPEAETAEIVMTCEFCNVDFRFPRRALRGQPAGD